MSVSRLWHVVGADFTGAELLEADFTAAVFTDAVFRRALMRRVSIKHIHEGARAIFDGADLRDAQVTDNEMPNSSWVGTELHAVAMEDTGLQGARIEQADLSGARFVDVRMQGALLLSTSLKGINMRAATGCCALGPSRRHDLTRGGALPTAVGMAPPTSLTSPSSTRPSKTPFCPELCSWKLMLVASTSRVPFLSCPCPSQRCTHVATPPYPE